ncbi:hypothetical protein CcarbDRAFT_4721 [Clostridium carboxidivorans P7]|uniref:Uncharacterized protein n=1 Tax=Clostridium carboxidivorans P7 TaxID=536227 RepID=C6Q104_9CLOT|nr:hypothetical protein CcarbDRAFT_4721 [Clostridium carboxidivorans P7]
MDVKFNSKLKTFKRTISMDTFKVFEFNIKK